MVKIVRIIGVAMFLLTVSSNVYAGGYGPKKIPKNTPTPKSTPTVVPTVAVPRTNPSPKGANYYHNDDYYARHPSAPTSTSTTVQKPADFGMVSVFRVSETTSVATPTPTPTVTAPQSNAYLNSTAYQNWRKQEMDTHQRVEYLNTPQLTPKWVVQYIQRPTPRPFVGSAAMSITSTCNGGPCPTSTPSPSPTPTPTPTQAPASNRARAIPK